MIRNFQLFPLIAPNTHTGKSTIPGRKTITNPAVPHDSRTLSSFCGFAQILVSNPVLSDLLREHITCKIHFVALEPNKSNELMISDPKLTIEAKNVIKLIKNGKNSIIIDHLRYTSAFTATNLKYLIIILTHRNSSYARCT